MFKSLLRDENGAAMLEYALLAAGIALISTAGVAVYGHKTNQMVSAVAAIVPGAHADDNGPIVSGQIVETTDVAETGFIATDVGAIVANTNTARLLNNVGLNGNPLANDDLLVLEPEPIP
ncbi:MAG: hypothetical protein AAGG01_11410 [Planctomycetota bacterium]